MTRKLIKRDLKISDTQIRENTEEGKRTIEGFIPYNSRSEYMGFYEYIAPTAFNKTLADHADVRCLMNHDDSKLLGRVKNGSLRLESRADGLHIECDLPPTSYANDVYNLIKDDYNRGLSFGMYIINEDYSEEEGVEVHTLREVRLLEVSFAVSFPAYEGTDSHARALTLDQIKEAMKGLPKEDLENIQAEFFESKPEIKTEESASDTPVVDKDTEDAEQDAVFDAMLEEPKSSAQLNFLGDFNMSEEKKDMVMEELRSAIDSIKEERAALEQQKAAMSAPAVRSTEEEVSVRSIYEAMKEKRAITLSGTGRVSVLSQIVKIIQEKNPLLEEVKFYYGPNSSTVIPILNPRPAVPSYAQEGATGISPDATASLGATTIQPFSWVSVLPVSYETLLLTGSNFEAELPGIFADAFRKAMCDGLFTGAGTTGTMKGIFAGVPSANKINCAASGAPTIVDVVGLAMKLKDYDLEDPVIVMNPAFYTGITTAAVSGYDFYREELIRNKTIEGIRVVLSGKAPSATTTGSVVVFGGSMSNYAIGVAADMTIEPLKKVGDTNTYYQAIMSFNGKPILEANNFALATV